MTKPAVAVVEDEDDVRAACVASLRAAGLTASGYTTARAALDAAKAGQLEPVVLFDLSLKGESSFDAMRAIRGAAPGTLLVAFTGRVGDEWLFPALSAGCVGYVLKTDGSRPLAEAVLQAAAGESPMSPGIARRVLERMHRPLNEEAPSLSPREVQVLQELTEGYRYEQVAARLGLSLSTVRTHVQSAYAKLGVSTKSEAAARAMRLGLVR